MCKCGGVFLLFGTFITIADARFCHVPIFVLNYSDDTLLARKGSQEYAGNYIRQKECRKKGYSGNILGSRPRR